MSLLDFCFNGSVWYLLDMVFQFVLLVSSFGVKESDSECVCDLSYEAKEKLNVVSFN